MSKNLVPSRINLKQLNQLIEGSYFVSNSQDFITASSVAKRITISADLVSRNLGFLSEIGILQKRRSGYVLTDPGMEYAQWLSWMKYEEAGEILAKILKKYEFANEIIHYIRVAGPLPRSDVEDRVGIQTGMPKSKRSLRGINTFVDLLVFSGIVGEEDGHLKITHEKTKTIEDQQHDLREASKVKPISGTSPRINISLHIDSHTEPDKLRKLLKVIKEELVDVALENLDVNSD